MYSGSLEIYSVYVTTWMSFGFFQENMSETYYGKRFLRVLYSSAYVPPRTPSDRKIRVYAHG